VKKKREVTQPDSQGLGGDRGSVKGTECERRRKRACGIINGIVKPQTPKKRPKVLRPLEGSGGERGGEKKSVKVTGRNKPDAASGTQSDGFFMVRGGL